MCEVHAWKKRLDLYSSFYGIIKLKFSWEKFLYNNLFYLSSCGYFIDLKIEVLNGKECHSNKVIVFFIVLVLKSESIKMKVIFFYFFFRFLFK